MVRQTYARRQLRANFRRFVAVNIWPLLLLALVLAGSTSLTRLLGGTAYQQGLIGGLLTVLGVAVTALLFLMHTEGFQ